MNDNILDNFNEFSAKKRDFIRFIALWSILWSFLEGFIYLSYHYFIDTGNTLAERYGNTIDRYIWFILWVLLMASLSYTILRKAISTLDYDFITKRLHLFLVLVGVIFLGFLWYIIIRISLVVLFIIPFPNETVVQEVVRNIKGVPLLILFRIFFNSFLGFLVFLFVKKKKR
jgi:hypothetical protein